MIGLRMNAFALACLLSSLILMSSSPPPIMGIDKLARSSGGFEVTTVGIVTDMRVYESGVERLIIADRGTSATVICLVSPGLSPHSFLGPGDMIEVRGDLTIRDEGPCIFSSYSGVKLLSKSIEALDVRTLCECWRLLEGKRLNVTGILESDEIGRTVLADESSPHRVAVANPSAVIVSLPARVTVCGTLTQDPETLLIGLVVTSILPC